MGTGAGKQRALRSPDVDSPWKAMLVIGAFGYMSAVLFIPLLNVFSQAFANGPGPFVENLTDEDFLHAMKMTFICAGIAVPVNTAFGLVAALWLARTESKFKPFLLSALDVPFSISPVVTGLMLVLLYGRNGWFAPILAATDFKVVFALPGIALATPIWSRLGRGAFRTRGGGPDVAAVRRARRRSATPHIDAVGLSDGHLPRSLQ